jgi:hypothetical protein
MVSSSNEARALVCEAQRGPAFRIVVEESEEARATCE